MQTRPRAQRRSNLVLLVLLVPVTSALTIYCPNAELGISFLQYLKTIVASSLTMSTLGVCCCFVLPVSSPMVSSSKHNSDRYYRELGRLFPNHLLDDCCLSALLFLSCFMTNSLFLFLPFLIEKNGDFAKKARF